MSEPTLLKQLLEFGLLEPDQIDALRQHTDCLTEAIVQRGWLTRFQIDQVAAGKGKRLFVGAYILLSPLGRGGMGQVFKARHRHMNRLVALKLMRKEKLTSAEAVQRFYREVEAAGRLSHPNIVLAFDAGQAGKTLFVAMEYIDGPDLSRLVRRRGPLPPAQACDYIRQAALGLQHAHERGMVHRDVKPKNLLAAGNEDGSVTVKVLDLGLARLDDAAPAQNRGLTRLGQVLGTPAYLAPEQARDSRTADIRADVYGLGCSLFFLLTGRAPFQARSRAEMLLKHQRETPPSLQQARPDAPDELDDLLQRLFAKKPEQRPGTPAEVAAALAPFARVEQCNPARVKEPPRPALPSIEQPNAAPRAAPASGPVILRRGHSRQAGRNRAPFRVVLAVGLLLLAGAVAAWLNLGSIRSNHDNEAVVNVGSGPAGPDQGSASDEKAAKAQPQVDPTKFGKSPEAVNFISRQLATVLEESVQAGRTARTEPVGGGEHYYYEVPKGGCLLVGLEVGVGRRAGQEVISSLRAIYLSDQGRFRGAVQGKQSPRTVTLEAKPGYALGGLTAKGGARLHGLSVTFMAIRGERLERSRSYQSEWVGGVEGKQHTLAGDGRLVIGVFGKIDDREAAGGLGLVTILPPAGL